MVGPFSDQGDIASQGSHHPTPIPTFIPRLSRTVTQKPTNILILDATRTIGRHITRALIKARLQFGRICVYTSARTIYQRVQYIAALESCGVEVYTGHLADEKAIKETIRDAEIDTIISCVGRSVLEKQIPIITWAEECGVTRFFASEFGTDVDYSPESKHEPPHHAKLAVREHMKMCKRMEYTYLVTGPYSDRYLSVLKDRPEMGSFDVRKRRACLLGNGEGLVSFTAMVDVGKFLVAALIHHNSSRNSTIVVHSFTATPNEILAEFEAQTGQPWHKTYTSLESLKKLEQQAYQLGSPLATALTLRRIWTEGRTLYKFYDNTLLGQVTTQTLEQQVTLSIKKQNMGSEEEKPGFTRKLSSL